MDFGSLHPVSVDLVREYLASDECRAITEEIVGRDRVSTGTLNKLTFGLATYSAGTQPVFAGDGLTLSAWEARVDRGIGMLMRPPSRIFIDAGFDPLASRKLDIRLDLAETAMGGAYIPAHLVEQCAKTVDEHLERSVKRMIDAGMDEKQLQSTMTEALRYVTTSGMGLFEAAAILDPFDAGTWPADSRVVTGSKDQALIDRIVQAGEPDQEEGLLRRSLRKFGIG